VLAYWTAWRAYAPRIFEYADGTDERQGGVGHKISEDLAKDYERRFRDTGGLAALGVSSDEAAARRALQARIAEWTVTVPGSVNDVEHNEANRDKNDAEGHRAVDKRQIDPAKFTTDFLMSVIGAGATSTQSSGRAPPPPLPGAATGLSGFNVSIEGVDPNQEQTPAEMQALIRAGKLTPDTLVYNPDIAAGWTKARDVPALAQAMKGGTRPPPPPLPR